MIKRYLLFLILFGLGPGLCLHVVFYGIQGGLLEKKILTNRARKEYVYGTPAVLRGIIYIIIWGAGFIGGEFMMINSFLHGEISGRDIVIFVASAAILFAFLRYNSKKEEKFIHN